MNKYRFFSTRVFFFSHLLLQYSVGRQDSQNDGTPQLNKLVEKLKKITDPEEKMEALRKFAIRQEAEKELAINETIMAEEAEIEQAVDAVKTEMALGTFLCAMSYIEAALEHIYRHEVAICNPWKRDRPLKLKTDDKLNQLVEPFYHRWVGFMHENRSRHHIWKFVVNRVHKKQYLEFAWSMPKIYFFCKDYVQGRRSKSLQRYRNLRASGVKQSLMEFLREHSRWRWILLKKDLDYLNILFEAAQLDEVEYAWLDKHRNLVVPFSADICLPPDRYLVGRNDTTVSRKNKRSNITSSGSTDAV